MSSHNFISLHLDRDLTIPTPVGTQTWLQLRDGSGRDIGSIFISDREGLAILQRGLTELADFMDGTITVEGSMPSVDGEEL
jgi:hypothetical protein